jgi:protease II
VPLPRGKKKEYGTELVLRNTATANERKFSDVLDFTISKDAKTLVFTTSSRKEETNGVYAVALMAMAPITLLSGKGKYQRLTWDEDNTQLAFTSDKEDADAKQPKFRVYHWNRKDPQATESSR